MPGYVAALHDLLRPGGRLLHHAIAWAAGDTTWDDDTFIARYVFPDGELLAARRDDRRARGGGFEILDVEALRRHYALTLRAWVDRLEKHWDAAVALASEGRARVWRLYMAAAALSFETGKLGVEPGAGPAPGRRAAAAAPDRLDLRPAHRGGKPLSPPAVTVRGPATRVPRCRLGRPLTDEGTLL